MAFLGKQHREFEKNIVRGYGGLNKKLHKLIDEVRLSENFPDDAKELLCGYQVTDSRGPFPFLKVIEEYLLTKDGIKYVRKSKFMSEEPRMTIEKKPTKEFIAKTIPVMNLTQKRPFSFETICGNLQKIIDKYEIEIDWKKYGKKSNIKNFEKFIKSILSS